MENANVLLIAYMVSLVANAILIITLRRSTKLNEELLDTNAHILEMSEPFVRAAFEEEPWTMDDDGTIYA